jgi:transcriptional regulator with XRE-family HTH domain
MTDVGYRFNKSQISKVETGTENRDFEIEELFAFADALRVPFAELVTPDPDEKPIRAGRERCIATRSQTGSYMGRGGSERERLRRPAA